LFVATLLPAVGSSTFQVVRELRRWWWLPLLVFVSVASTHPGAPPQGLSWSPLSASGMAAGSLTLWRLVLVVGLGVLFTASTRQQELAGTVHWLAARLGLPGARLGLMVGLTIRFLPLLLDESDTLREALRARGADRRPLFGRTLALGRPLLRNTLLRSEHLAEALLSRGYHDRRPVSLPPLSWSALFSLLALLLILALALAMP